MPAVPEMTAGVTKTEPDAVADQAAHLTGDGHDRDHRGKPKFSLAG
jgi:hypothetical protein